MKPSVNRAFTFWFLAGGCFEFTVLFVSTQRSWKNTDDEWASKTEWHRNKQTFWSIRADVVRKFDRGEPEPETIASSSAASPEPLDASDPSPF